MADPGHIVAINDFSARTIRRIIAQLEVSTTFEHLVYREAELDAIWSITGFFFVSETNADLYQFAERLHRVVHEAHDLVADGRAADAAAILRDFLVSSGEDYVVP